MDVKQFSKNTAYLGVQDKPKECRQRRLLFCLPTFFSPQWTASIVPFHIQPRSSSSGKVQLTYTAHKNYSYPEKRMFHLIFKEHCYCYPLSLDTDLFSFPLAYPYSV